MYLRYMKQACGAVSNFSRKGAEVFDDALKFMQIGSEKFHTLGERFVALGQSVKAFISGHIDYLMRSAEYCQELQLQWIH